MQIIGITGGIGSGKSIVSEMIRISGFPVFNSDEEAKKILKDSKEVRELLKKEFGNEIFLSGEIDRKKLAEIVFKDKNKLIILNGIIHPRVKKRFDDWKNSQSSQIVFKEAAILIESGSYKDCDKVIVITAPKEIRISRVMKRDNSTEDSILERMKNQLSEEELTNKADYIIINDENHPLIPQVMRILQELRNAC